MTFSLRDGHSEATIAIDAGTAPAGGCIGSAGDGAAHAGDAEDAEDVPAEVWLVPFTLGTPDAPRPWHRGPWEAHEALGPHPFWQSPNPSPTQIPWNGLIIPTFFFKRLQKDQEEEMQSASLNLPGPITPLAGS